MDQTDAHIVRLVLAGDVEAFALLVDRYHGQCLRVATHLLGDGDEADDAVQEAFVRAYRHLGGYRERQRFGAWLLRIVINQCRTRVNANWRWVYNHPSEVAVPPDSEANDRRAELAHALAQLAPDQREAVVLRFAESMSYDEMSAATGVDVSALKMRVQRACSRLRTLLSDYINA